MAKKRLEKFITFKLGKEKYALPASSGNQFIQFSQVMPLPNVEAGILGLIYYNGGIVTILDIKKILKIKDSKKISNNVCLIFELNNYYYAILVDEGDETVGASKVFNDRQKKFFKRYFKDANKNKIYILEEDEILSQANIL